MAFTSFDKTKSNVSGNTGIVLSNGGLTVGFTSPSGVSNGAAGFSADDITNTGKNYIEFRCTIHAGAVIGVFPEGSDTNYSGMTSGSMPFGGFALFPDGTIRQGGATIGSISSGAIADGDVIGLAYDFATPLGWFKNITQGSDWNSSPSNDPATGVGGLAATSGALVPGVAFIASSGTAQITANFGASSFVGTVPSGFTSGWVGAGVTPGGTSTAWNPSDSTGFSSFTDNDHTAFSGVGVGGNNGVRATPTTHTSGDGKVYLEFYNVSFQHGVGGGAIGLKFLADALGSDAQFGVNLGGALYTGLPRPAGTFAGSPWAVVGMAIDFNALTFWMTLDGITWQGTGAGGDNPATGTNGADISGSPSASPLIPFFYTQQIFGLSGSCSINTGDRAFQLTQPAGFASWDNNIPGPVVGDLAATEAPDVFAGVGNVAATISMRITEKPDIFSAFGRQPQGGVMIVSEAPDKFTGTGIGLGEDGTWFTTEAPDIFSGAGSVPIVGQFATTETPDRFRAIGAGVIQVNRRRPSFVT